MECSVDGGARPAVRGRSKRHKITEEQARLIKRNPEKKLQKLLAYEFGICQQFVSEIQTGKKWKWL